MEESKDSTFDLITQLCTELIDDHAFCNDPSKKKRVVKQLRSQAFEIILNSRSNHSVDEFENSPASILGNILGHVYSKSKAKGRWNKDMMEDVGNLIEKAEAVAESNPSIMPVLKFLLYLADSAPSPERVHDQDPGHGSIMKILITDHSFKHKPLIKPQSIFNLDIFELPAANSEHVDCLHVLSEKPGTGLKHRQFFIPSIFTTHIESIKFEEDVNNGNWFHSKMNNMVAPLRNTNADPRSSMHLDEGYVTPDQDLVEEEAKSYIPWEDMDRVFNLVYRWEGYGSAVIAKEPQFIFQERDSVEPISRVILACDTMSNHGVKTELTIIKTVSVEELEVAFNNLLVGVESTIFHYDKGQKSFVLQKSLCLKGSTAITLEEYCKDFIECGNRFRQLSKITRHPKQCGLVFQMLCNNLRQYLQCYRGVVLKMPATDSLLETRDWLYKLSSQMQFLISLSPVSSDRRSKDLLIYLCDKMPVLYRHDLAYIYYYILQSCFTVYFTFLSKWIFEGVTSSMWEEEFFIRCNPLTEDMYNRKFWSEGFLLDQELVPNCLKGLESKLLLCGKSMALLNLCASDDPLCKRVKREHPDIICCFNKDDLNRVEERFESYKDNCKAECQQLYGNSTPEIHNEDYYAGLMAKTLNEIKGRQEDERRLMAEKKQSTFNMLKKEMEDAKARKVEEKINLLKSEKKLIEEAEKVDKLNDLRRQEEREKIMHLYSSLSEAADRRRDRAEWKMKRAELYDKRCAFWKKEKEWLEENLKHRIENTQGIEESKLLVAEKSLEKYLETYSPITGSGDYVLGISGSVESLQESSKRSVQQTDKTTSKEVLELDEPKNWTEDSALNYDKRDWMIALDVAGQARQSALKFKQRNMNNDYNIITGEESTFESKFGEKHPQETEKESFSYDIASPDIKDKSSGDDKDINGVPDADITVSSDDNTVNEEKITDEHSGSNKPLISHTDSPKKLDSSESKPEVNGLEPKSILNTSFATTQSENEPHMEEIDMISIYQNVQRSIMIPLLAHLELTGDAIVRLFHRHNLLQHMECIWKYFFLLEGEFARNLTANLFQEAQKAQHPCYLLNVMKLNSLLRCAVRTNVDEEYTERLSFYVKEIPSVFRSLDPGMLDCLSLIYKTHWPINIIITDELIAKQGLIFKHLLKLHRMSWALEECVYLLKDKKLLSSQEYRKVQLFRHVMTHFINAIKHYITAVVVKKTWSELKVKFETATTVDTMFELYRFYIRSVNSKCLLGKARVHTEQWLNNLFKEILIFYEALRSGEWVQDAETGYFRHSNFSRINHAFDNFKKIADHLVYLFRKMSSSFPNIEQLATALSLNDFYSPKEREHSHK